MFKLTIHERGDFFVFERFVRHDMAPVTGGITNRKKDRLVFPTRLLKRFLAPWIPIDGTMRMLQKIRRLLLRDFVCSGRAGLGSAEVSLDVTNHVNARNPNRKDLSCKRTLNRYERRHHSRHSELKSRNLWLF
jgi:hypothetical protein